MLGWVVPQRGHLLRQRRLLERCTHPP
jgi:hypothetical protein